MKQKIIRVIIVILIVVFAFYGGIVYDKKTNSTNGRSSNLRGGQNLTDAQRAQFSQRQNGEMGLGLRQNNNSTNFINGEIISKESGNLTIKLPDGGSALIYVTTSTTNINKQTTSTLSEIKVGDKVIINGDKNSDGSYSAKMIRL